MPSLKKKWIWNGCEKSDPAYTIRHDSGCTLAAMVITGRNQNTSGLDPACLLGNRRKISFLKHKLSRHTLIYICHRQTHRVYSCVYNTQNCVSICLSLPVCVCLPVCLSCLPVFICVCLWQSVFVPMCVCLLPSVRACLCMTTCLLACLSLVSLCVSLPVSVCLFLCLSLSVSVSLFVYLPASLSACLCGRQFMCVSMCMPDV